MEITERTFNIGDMVVSKVSAAAIGGGKVKANRALLIIDTGKSKYNDGITYIAKDNKGRAGFFKPSNIVTMREYRRSHFKQLCLYAILGVILMVVSSLIVKTKEIFTLGREVVKAQLTAQVSYGLLIILCIWAVILVNHWIELAKVYLGARQLYNENEDKAD